MDEFEDRKELWSSNTWQRHQKLAPSTMYTYLDSPAVRPRPPKDDYDALMEIEARVRSFF